MASSRMNASISRAVLAAFATVVNPPARRIRLARSRRRHRNAQAHCTQTTMAVLVYGVVADCGLRRA